VSTTVVFSLYTNSQMFTAKWIERQGMEHSWSYL